MADIKQKYKTPNGDNIIDMDFADFKENGGDIGGHIVLPNLKYLGNVRSDGSIINVLATDTDNFTSVGSHGNPGSERIYLRSRADNPYYRSPNWTTTIPTLRDFANATTTNGYTKLPNGMIMQWGEYYSANGGTATLNYPIRFPQNMRTLQFTSRWGSANTLILVSGSATDNLANFVVRPGSETVAYTVQWFAMGY